MLTIKLDKKMKEKGLSILQMKAKSGVSFPTIQRLTNSKKIEIVNFTILSKLAKALELESPLELIEWSEEG